MKNSFFDSFEDKTIFVKGTNQEVSPWDKTKIIAILMDESGIPFNIAEKIADDVQKAVFSSNLKTISSSLLRELVNAKLVEYGYSKILNKTRRLGLSTSDVKEVITNPIPYGGYAPVTPALSSNYISDTVKRQFSAFNVFPEKLINYHYEGRLHINGINGIDRIFSIAIDVSRLLTFNYAGDNFFITKPVDGFQFFENLKKIVFFLSHFVNDCITLFGIEKAIAYFNLENDKKHIIEIFLKDTEHILINTKPVKVFLKDKDLVKVAASLFSEQYFLKTEILTPSKTYIPSKNISIFNGEFGNSDFIMENITLNLPGIALESKLKNSDFFKELKIFLENTYALFGKKGIFIEKMLMTKGYSILDFLKKIGFSPLSSSYAISVCGLQEAVSLLREKYKFDEKDIDFAYSILSILKEVIEDLNKKYRLKVKLSDSDQNDVIYRFARLNLKFEPYYVSKIVKGDLATGGVFYSPNASFITNFYLNAGEVIDIENKFKEIYDLPFKTIIKVVDFDNVKIKSENFYYRYLMLTQDFSVCYHCYVMNSGIYKSCPECLSGDIENYYYLYSSHIPYSKLNRALRVMIKNIVYYEEFTI